MYKFLFYFYCGTTQQKNHEKCMVLDENDKSIGTEHILKFTEFLNFKNYCM